MKDLAQAVFRSPHGDLTPAERLQLLQQRSNTARRRHELLTGELNPGAAGPGQFLGDGVNRVSLNGRLKEHFDAIAGATLKDLENVAKADDAARDRSGKERSSHNGLRIITTENWLLPNSIFAATFFETVSLQPDEQPLYRKKTKAEIPIYTYGKNGKPGRVTLQDTDYFANGTPIPMKFLKSARVEYRIEDVNRGNLRDAALETFDLGADMAAKVDLEAFTFANTAAYTASFDFTNAAKVERVVNAHSRVNVANFPVGNLVTAGADPVLLTLLRGIKDYCARFAGVLPGGDLMPTGRIFIAPKDIDRIWGQNDLTGVSAAKSKLGEQVQAEGWTSFHFLGTDWMLVPDNTLAPATTSANSGSMYVQLNKPIGTLFLKPSMDREIVKLEEEADPLGGDLESRYVKKPIALVVPADRLPNGYRIRYHFGA